MYKNIEQQGYSVGGQRVDDPSYYSEIHIHPEGRSVVIQLLEKIKINLESNPM